MIALRRSFLYYPSKALAETITEPLLVTLIDAIQDDFPGYGYRGVTRELYKRGHRVNNKGMARVMRTYDLGNPKRSGRCPPLRFFDALAIVPT
jgi:putative transposase